MWDGGTNGRDIGDSCDGRTDTIFLYDFKYKLYNIGFLSASVGVCVYLEVGKGVSVSCVFRYFSFMWADRFHCFPLSLL